MICERIWKIFCVMLMLLCPIVLNLSQFDKICALTCFTGTYISIVLHCSLNLYHSEQTCLAICVISCHILFETCATLAGLVPTIWQLSHTLWDFSHIIQYMCHTILALSYTDWNTYYLELACLTLFGLVPLWSDLSHSNWHLHHSVGTRFIMFITLTVCLKTVTLYLVLI